ncbi:MAG: cytochrome c oxidase accessory protein CcoG [Polyangiaceae bacterium]
MSTLSQPKTQLRVLPTLNADGTRIRIRPKVYPGRFGSARAWVGWALIIIFVSMPILRIGGHPAMFLDVAERKFHLFGRTFLATDGVLLMLFLLSTFVAIFWLTTLLGRAWCGWGCPQTVYMELLFRPIERWFEGDRSEQAKLDRRAFSLRRFGKNLVYALLAIVLANVFLSYFVGVERLKSWIVASPFERPAPFLVMATTALLVFLDFAWFREQMCTVACPYARLQAVLLDQRSLIIGYDAKRGEPRGKGKLRTGQGDCVDCSACVIACPTGIDIREGLQLECIACAKCVDACDSVMDKLGQSRGLVRYASQEALRDASAKVKLLRPRVVLYPLLILVFLVLMFTIANKRTVADVTVLRGIGLPYVVVDGKVQNQLRIKVENRRPSASDFRIELVGADDATLIAPENPLRVGPDRREQTSVFVLSDPHRFTRKERPIVIRVSDGLGYVRDTPYKLLGPEPTKP